ncbi:DUF3604 domain-containing protein [Vibrio sp. Isolate33]|uniref:DUF3604 domain-containing protein n=1 Tax=Vibrio TaxID=662 RepID=UPI00159D2A12|nr:MULTISPECIES: DUF3604 domain-containing protein [Vibrio]MCG9543547.1 DUF3604 domain-containing protein [Vibrio sp. Isolate33]NVN80374.1 DUF3604 domain-containing protein [Vibrio sp. Scap16]QLE95808.1 DUF3604 domain-containing protein [Vibrio sp. Scap24]
MKKINKLASCVSAILLCSSMAAQADITVHENKEAYFGNLHVHTGWSFDGFPQGATFNPETAYRWARGEKIVDENGNVFKIQGKPLDWYSVTDHAEFLGVFQQMVNPESDLYDLDISKRLASKNKVVAWGAYADIFDCMNKNSCDPRLVDPKLAKSLFAQTVEITDKYNTPGQFTTFAGFEWTSGPEARNMHRVLMFRDTDHIPEIPFTSFDSKRPEDLWAWMDKQRENGSTLLAIPHNGNASDGLMFPVDTSYGGSKVDKAYAETRMRNEPLYEITQIKGTSETHPELSPNDEFAGFELWDYRLDMHGRLTDKRVGGYARDALLRGIKQEAEGQGNPYKFGFIGDADTHNGASTFQEFNFTGKFGVEVHPEERMYGSPGNSGRNIEEIRKFSTSGLAAVWAKSNTREEIYDALANKEVYATTGTRMKVRTFASFDYPQELLKQADWEATAYDEGVPMGSDLTSADIHGKTAPTIIVQAEKDPDSGNLDRIQIIKGWVKDGKTFEKVYNVAMSDGRVENEHGKVPAVGNTVDVKTATFTNDIGAESLQAEWVDPDFDESLHAFYYARVLEIPTPRWSTFDAVEMGTTVPEELPVSIQERAFTSPIWYTP